MFCRIISCRLVGVFDYHVHEDEHHHHHHHHHHHSHPKKLASFTDDIGESVLSSMIRKVWASNILAYYSILPDMYSMYVCIDLINICSFLFSYIISRIVCLYICMYVCIYVLQDAVDAFVSPLPVAAALPLPEVVDVSSALIPFSISQRFFDLYNFS